MLSLMIQLNAQEKEVNIIKEQVKKFSDYLMNDERAEVVAMYTADAKIFPNNMDILEGEALSNYWNPKESTPWKTTYHKVTPIEIKILGNEAYDYGYYEGKSTNGETESAWRGKYVIVWKKEEGEWRIYLDIWNNIKND
jgi:ketosteroid isomerase-like protein